MGVIVGKTPRSRREQRSETLKGNKVTMGNGVPRQGEGAIGDITVREITIVGLRTYIKTNSGWYDINSMTAGFIPAWIDINLKNGWLQHATTAIPQYVKDTHGFIHLRGAVKGASYTATTISATDDGSDDFISDSASGFVSQGFVDGGRVDITGFAESSNNKTGAIINTVAAGKIIFTTTGFTTEPEGESVAVACSVSTANPICTLPAGFRPANTIHCFTVGEGSAGDVSNETDIVLARIDSSGNVSFTSASGDSRYTQLDGISFFAGKKATSIAAGQEFEQSDIGHGVVL